MANNYKLYLYGPSAISKTSANSSSDFLGELLVDNLAVNLKLSDISDIVFTMPRVINGESNTRLDQVLDNYIVELWYGTQTTKEKMRFVINSLPLSFDNGVYKYEYHGMSIEAALENKQITSWGGVEINDFFRKIIYNKNSTSFTNSNTNQLTIQPAIMSGNLEISAAYIELSPTTTTTTPLDIFITEERVDGLAQSSASLIEYGYDWDDRAINSVKFAAGHYNLALDVNGYVTAIRIALPSVSKDLVNFLSSNINHKFYYKLYDNPTSRFYAAGINTNEAIPTDSMYFDLMGDAQEGEDTQYNGHDFSAEKYFSKNGLTLKQVLTGDLEETTINENGLLYKTGFTLGTVVSTISSKYRSNLEFNDITVYQAIKSLAESFEAVAIFNTINNTVSFYEDIGDDTYLYGENKGLIIQYGTYLKAINKEIDAGKIGTHFIGLGKDNLTISLINPDGSNYWEDYTYFLDDYKNLTVIYNGSFSFGSDTNFSSRWIPNGDVLNLAKWQKVRDYFHNIMLSSSSADIHADHIKYVNLYSLRDEAIKNYVKEETIYSQFVAAKYKYKILMDYYGKTNAVSGDNSDRYNYYKELYDKSLSSESTKKTELNTLYKSIFDVNTPNSFAAKINEIKVILNGYKNLINDSVLIAFRKELVFKDTNLDNEKDLLEGLTQYVLENREPKVTININIVDILAAQEAEQDHNKMVLGDRLNLYFDEFNIDLEAQIKEISIDFEQNSLSLVIATTKNYNRGFGNYLTKIVRKLYNQNININSYAKDTTKEAVKKASKAAEKIETGDISTSNGAVDESGAASLTTNDAGTTALDIASVNPLTGTVTYSEPINRLDISNGAVISTHKSDTDIFTKVGMGSEFGFFIAKSDDNEETYTKQFYVDTSGNTVFNGTLSAGVASLFDAAGSANTAYTNAVATANSYTDSELSDLQTLLQNQIDGAISTWFYSGAPTLLNLPASEWTTDDMKNAHLGDLYYDTLNGYAYRFAYEAPDYKWIQIVDTDVTTALANAATAQTTADSKMTIYYASNATELAGITTQETGDLLIIGANFGAYYQNDSYTWSGTAWVKSQNIENKNTGSVAGWTIDSTKIYSNNSKIILNSDIANSGANPYIGLVKTSYADTTSGAFIGLDSGAAKLNIGNNTNWLKWTGSSLEIAGTIKQTSILETAAGNFNVNDSLNYNNDITGGTRSIYYDATGLTPNPSTSLQFSAAPKVGGVLWSDKVNYSWSATGSMSGTSTASTFTPTIASSLTNNTSIVLTVTYYTTTAKTTILYTKTDTIAINITRVGDTGPQGPQGPAGADGTDGTNGLPAYIHYAYATSADGQQNFNTEHFSGATYLGIYTDFNATDSTNYLDYDWSLFKGTDGAPGEDGANGLNAYVHHAYATSADGSAGFSLTYTGVETYSGWYSDFTIADSTTYTDYEWSKFQGPQGPEGPIGLTGPTGPIGATGAGVVYRGVYNSSEYYFHTSERKDIVRYGSSYYIVNNLSKSGYNTWGTPGTSDWVEFGAQFSSVATDILFAQDVYANKTINIGSAGSTPVISLNSDAANSNANPYIGINKTSYTDNTNGLFMGYSASNPVVYIGNATNWLKWDTTNGLDIKGAITASSGYINDWQIGSGTNSAIISPVIDVDQAGSYTKLQLVNASIRAIPTTQNGTFSVSRTTPLVQMDRRGYSFFESSNTVNTPFSRYGSEGISFIGSGTNNYFLNNIDLASYIVSVDSGYLIRMQSRDGVVVEDSLISSRDSILLKPRAGGSSSYRATLIPDTLTDNRTITIPDTTGVLGIKNDIATGSGSRNTWITLSGFNPSSYDFITFIVYRLESATKYHLKTFSFAVADMYTSTTSSPLIANVTSRDFNNTKSSGVEFSLNLYFFIYDATTDVLRIYCEVGSGTETYYVKAVGQHW